MKNLIFAAVTAHILSGCAAAPLAGTVGQMVGADMLQTHLDNQSRARHMAAVTDAQLQKRAAFALNTQPENVRIANREIDSDDLYFTAAVGQNAHLCYVSVENGKISDARCLSDSASPSAVQAPANAPDSVPAANNPLPLCTAAMHAAGLC